MAQENHQPNDALELSIQELDTVAGGATSDVFGRNLDASDSQLGFVKISRDGSIESFTVQETIFSEQELAEFNATDAI